MTTDAATKTDPKPRRGTRRKLSAPLNLALFGVLIALVSFWLGGMLQDDSSGSSTPSMPSFGDTGSMPGGGSFPGGGDNAAQGEITSLKGNTLYVSESDGTTVKVKVRSTATVTRNANVKADQLHPGDTVTVTGKTNSAGVVKADSVTATQAGVQPAMPSFPGGASEGENQ